MLVQVHHSGFFKGIQPPGPAVFLDHRIVRSFFSNPIQRVLNGLAGGLGAERFLRSLQFFRIQPGGNLNEGHSDLLCPTRYTFASDRVKRVARGKLGMWNEECWGRPADKKKDNSDRPASER